MTISFITFVAAAFAAPAVASSSLTMTATPIMAHTPQTLGEYVKEYYQDEPILAEIARCESMYRQLNADGEVLRGKVNSYDVGVMQINLQYHEKRATELGYDLHTLEGNLAYAKYLYSKEGTAPWSSSAPCWKKKTS